MFMFLIFKETFNKAWEEGRKRFSTAIYLLAATVVVSALGIYAYVNLPGWSYYVKSRAANHFVITTSDKAFLQLSLSILLILCVILLLATNYRYKYVSFFLLCSVCISLTAYPLYAIPYAIACLCLALKINEKLCVPPILILLGLFVLQAFPSHLISITTSMLLPATRFTSILTLYLLCLLVLEIGKRARRITYLPLKSGYISMQRGKIAVILLIITTANILIYAKITNENFSALKKTITIENKILNKVNSELIFLDVPSQGWREFGNMQIFVDEYPFWGNLEEYRHRNLFRERLLKLAFTRELNWNKVETLKEVFDVNTNLVLVTTKKNLKYFGNFNCSHSSANYFCDLEAMK